MKSALHCLLPLTILTAGCYGLFQLSKARTFQFFGELTASVKTNKKVIAITFDDAPSPYSDEVLKILGARNAKATFYVVGKAMEGYPAQAKEIVRHGHELGNHSYSHRRMVLKSRTFIANEIEMTDRLIRDAGYNGEITFRPPNGKKLFSLPLYLKGQDKKTVMWNIEPDTYYSGDAKK